MRCNAAAVHIDMPEGVLVTDFPLKQHPTGPNHSIVNYGDVLSPYV